MSAATPPLHLDNTGSRLRDSNNSFCYLLPQDMSTRPGLLRPRQFPRP